MTTTPFPHGSPSASLLPTASAPSSPTPTAPSAHGGSVPRASAPRRRIPGSDATSPAPRWMGSRSGNTGEPPWSTLISSSWRSDAMPPNQNLVRFEPPPWQTTRLKRLILLPRSAISFVSTVFARIRSSIVFLFFSYVLFSLFYHNVTHIKAFRLIWRICWAL